MTQKNKILVVEDNDFVRMQIVRFLQEENFEVVETSGGREALEQISDDVDMAIVDVRMEPMDGFEFIKTIRGLNMNTPVVLVTGDQNPELLHQASSWGVVAVLMKPVERDRLIKTVSKTIQNIARAS